MLWLFDDLMETNKQEMEIVLEQPSSSVSIGYWDKTFPIEKEQ